MTVVFDLVELGNSRNEMKMSVFVFFVFFREDTVNIADSTDRLIT